MRHKIPGMVAAAAALISLSTGSAQASGAFSAQVLSDRADVISGGDALVAVALPRRVNPAAVRVALGGSDVTNEFAMRSNGSYEGLLTGLQLGRNTLTAVAPG